MYISVQNAHVNGLYHNSFFWTLFLPCSFQKIKLSYMKHLTDLSHLCYRCPL